MLFEREAFKKIIAKYDGPGPSGPEKLGKIMISNTLVCEYLSDDMSGVKMIERDLPNLRLMKFLLK